MQRVLFVDDNRRVLAALHRQLRQAPFDFMFATGAQEAIAIARQIRVDVVVSDFHMPDILGPELFALLRPLRPDAYFVLLSAKAEPSADQLQQWGVVKYFAKPWDDEKIIDFITQLGPQDNEGP
ncbi:response regulator [Salinispirillum sp. LH 10-3-1]|uniref:Response regulator n=1 Tax=Salinispirillum sp. LH 10-3-1 TaxID=2952525 RepID=A0AB38YI77_9GAMM